MAQFFANLFHLLCYAWIAEMFVFGLALLWHISRGTKRERVATLQAAL